MLQFENEIDALCSRDVFPLQGPTNNEHTQQCAAFFLFRISFISICSVCETIVTEICRPMLHKTSERTPKKINVENQEKWKLLSAKQNACDEGMKK